MSHDKLALAKETGFRGIGPGVWFATYDPAKNGNLELHFRHGTNPGLEVYEIRQVTDQRTEAVWYTINGAHHTVESLGDLGRFTVPLSDYLSSGQFGHYRQWICATGNIKPLESWLEARGDTAAVEKMKETFPKIFVPPVTPKPECQLQSQPKPRKRWLGLF